jgi:hypothetical protein
VKAIRSACKNPLECLSCSEESISGGIETWKVQRTDEGRNHLIETKLKRKDAKLFG